MTSPERGSASADAGGRLCCRALGVVDVPLDGEHGQHPARADERARHLVDGLGGGAERDDEKRRVAVERDELAGLICPETREPRTEPGDEDDEQPWDEHLGRVERRLRERDVHARDPHRL